MKIAKCPYCNQTPSVVRLPGDLFYVQCTCGKNGLYDFLGTTTASAIDCWNKTQFTRSLYLKGGDK